MAAGLLSVDDASVDKTFPTGGQLTSTHSLGGLLLTPHPPLVEPLDVADVAGAHEVHLVESWESPDAFPHTKGNRTRQIHAYTSAPYVELLVNGKSQGARAVTRMRDGPGSYAEWNDVPWEAGKLSAVAHDASGTAVATTARHTNGAPTALQLSVDAPSVATGTGSALLLDGQDCALLRAAVIDGSGRVMHLAAHNISFRVVSGPGRVQGAHNGDTHSHLRNDLPWYPV